MDNLILKVEVGLFNVQPHKLSILNKEVYEKINRDIIYYFTRLE
jgi:hypothetical protein